MHGFLRPFAFIAILTAFTTLACQGNPTSPDQPAPPESPSTSAGHGAQAHHSLGFKLVSIDTESLAIDVLPSRTVNWHFNMTGVLNGTMGVSAATVPGESDPPNGLFVLDITLTHPFGTKPQFSGFDVKGILITPGTLALGPLVFADIDETRLENADGYTRWWNPTEFTESGILGYTEGNLAIGPAGTLSATVNPYKLFADILGAEDSLSFVSDEPLDSPGGRAVFAAGSVNTRRYRIRFPLDPGPQVIFGYAIDCAWNPPVPNPPGEIPDDFPIEANQPEAFRIGLVPTVNTLYYDSVAAVGGGTLILQINVHDWQGQDAGNIPGEIDAVRIFAPGLMPGGVDAVFLNETPTKARYIADLSGLAVATETGEQLIICRVGSSDGSNYQQTGAPAPDSPLSAYHVITVDVAELPECFADTNNTFMEAVELGLNDGFTDTVCNITDDWDFYSFEVPAGYEVSGDITLYCDVDSTTIFLFNWSELELAYLDAIDGLASFDMNHYSLVPGTYYLAIQSYENFTALYHIDLNVSLTEETTGIVLGELTPPTLFCNPDSVFVQDDHALFLGDLGFWVYDVTSVTSPVLLHNTLFTPPIDVFRVSISDRSLYYTVHGEFSDYLHNFDLTDYANPVLHENVMVYETVTDQAMNSEHLFVIVDNDFANVYSYAADPVNPVLVNTIDFGHVAQRPVLWDAEGPDTHLIVADGTNIYSYDVEDILSISADGTYTPAQGSVRDLATNDSYIYALTTGSGDGWLYVLEQGASDLTYKGSAYMVGWVDDLIVTNQYAYISVDLQTVVFDISDPLLPVYKGAIMYPLDPDFLAIDTAGDYLYTILQDAGFQIDDVSALPATLQHRTSVANNTRSAVSFSVTPNRYLVVLDYVDQDNRWLKTIDITDPANAFIAAEFALSPSFEIDLAYGDDLIVVGNGVDTFSLVDASDPLLLAINDSATLTGPISALAINNQTVYAADYDNAITTYDVTVPASLVYKSTIAALSRVNVMAFTADYMYGITSTSIDVYNISDPWLPVYEDSITPVEPYPKDAAVYGNYLYVLTANDFEIYDITTPASPALLGSEFLFATNSGSVFDHSSMYAFAHGMDYIYPAVIDLSQPANPTRILTMDYYYGASRDVIERDGGLYMISSRYGVRIFELN